MLPAITDGQSIPPMQSYPRIENPMSNPRMLVIDDGPTVRRVVVECLASEQPRSQLGRASTSFGDWPGGLANPEG
jgi:hypothetical protein